MKIYFLYWNDCPMCDIMKPRVYDYFAKNKIDNESRNIDDSEHGRFARDHRILWKPTILVLGDDWWEIARKSGEFDIDSFIKGLWKS